MAKNFNLGKTLGSPTPSFSVDAIEEMTRVVHEKKQIPAVATPKERIIKTKKEEQPADKPNPKPVAKKESELPVAKVPAPVQEPVKRGRKPSPPASDERMIRVSVDLPESIFIKLKTKVIQDRTDMKTFVWRLIEDRLK
jgi:hypothetical protein